jgi:hypothetical protein
MTEGDTMKTLVAALAFFSLAILSVPAQSQVLRCADEMASIQDDWLQRTAVELKLEYPNIAFQGDDRPCLHGKETVKALTKTFGRNYLKSILGYEFVKVINGEEYFTVERFKSRAPKELQALATALRNNPSHKLKIEANTSYEYFVAGDSIVLMISSASGHKDHSEMFGKVRQSFSSLVSIR